MFLLGSMSCCISAKALPYLVGSFSHVALRRDTAAWPSPDTMANIELKFCVSLHWRAILMNCKGKSSSFIHGCAFFSPFFELFLKIDQP